MNSIDSEKIKKLGSEILLLSRNTLLVNLRFLDLALSKLEFETTNEYHLATNGETLFYNPFDLMESYKNEKEAPVRDYLHVIMHCVFRHMFVGYNIRRDYWDLACDIAIENIINELSISATVSNRARQQQGYINQLKQKLDLLTAEKIYAYLVENVSEDRLKQTGQLFCADDHKIWYTGSNPRIHLSGNNNNQDDSEPDSTDENGDTGPDSGSNNDSSQQDNDMQSYASYSGKKQLEEFWKSVSERMQVDLDTFSKEQGDQAGNLIQNIKAVNREKYDYKEFLKKFAVIGEAMKINDDEFDYVFYTYGLKLYKKMPLIEPLEYKEMKLIKEFVIAIDTSGSVQGDLISRFVQKTYNILKSTESFCNRINLHIIQCDAEIQKHTKITNQTEFDAYIKNLTIKGLGGTDFRPVFSLVDKLIQEKEFSNLKGLIYFTDGCGTFPSQKPPYNTAFVFIQDNYIDYWVPPWAIKLVLQKDEI